MARCYLLLARAYPILCVASGGRTVECLYRKYADNTIVNEMRRLLQYRHYEHIKAIPRHKLVHQQLCADMRGLIEGQICLHMW